LTIFDENIYVIAHGLISDKEEKSKEKLLINMMNGKGINITKNADLFRENASKEIIVVRRNLKDLLKIYFDCNIINKDNDWNEPLFYDIVLKGRDFIALFLEKYKIKKLLFNSKKFEDVIQNYQSFNYSALKSLKEEIENLICFKNHTFLLFQNLNK
jgi:hypothetical protein